MTEYRRVPFLTFVVSPYQKVKINLAGCNFNCKGCFAIAKHEVGRELSVEELLILFTKSCQLIYGKIADDVQMTGGEPTVNTDYLLCLIRRLRELRVSRIGISTNGYLLDRNLVEELKFWGVNHIKLDLKAYTDEIHRWYTGRSNVNVLKAVQLLSEYDLNFYVRTIYIPNMVDFNEIEKIATFLSYINKNITYKIYQPTGQYLSRRGVETILDALRDGLLVLDEAYIGFVDGSWCSIDLISRGNVVIVRSMTKDYALAGLRLGYAIGNQEIIDALRRVRPPWNVNIMAQKAGVIALDDKDYVERCRQEIRQAKLFLTSELCRIGFTLVPSSTNFFLVRVGDAKAFRTALLRHGILVRDCTSFGLPEYVRIAPRTMPECQKLITTIQSLKQEGKLDAST